MPLRQLTTALCLLAAAALFVAGCGSSGSDTGSTGGSSSFRLGLEAPLSGEQSVLGKGMLKGAELAVERLNEKGGIEGKEVEIVPIDDAADPETGVEAAEAAIEDGLDGIVGPYNSGVGVETLPLYIDAGLVPVRLTSDNSTNGLGYTLQPMTYQIAPVASEALTDWLHAKKVAIAYDPTELYTRVVSETLKGLLEEAGVTVTAFEKIKPGEDDYSAVVEKLEADNPDVIYAGVYYPEGGLIAKAMEEGHSAAKCVADYGSYDTGFVETAGVPAARACPVVGVPAPEDFEGSSSYVAEYRDQFGEDPGTWSPYTYDSVDFLAEGIAKAGGTDAAKLEDALDAVKGWKGWTGSVSIDPEERQPPAGDRGHRRHGRQGQAPRRRGLGQGRRRPVLSCKSTRGGVVSCLS